MEETYAQNQCTNNASAIQTPRVGGVALDQAATFLADMTEYTGAYYDDVNKRIVFIGRTNTSSPQFEKDDLAVAIKTLFFDNIIPAVSLEPHATDSSKMAVQFTGNLEDTKFGQTLLDADWKLKQYIHGYDENNNPVVSSVPSYKSVLERYIDLGPGTTGNSSRWWIVPNLVSLKKDDSTDSFVFDDVQMEVLTEPTSESNLPNWDQAAEDFADNLTTHYNDYADETPEFFKVKQLAKIVAVIKWLKDTGIESNMQWAKEYEPKFEATPRTMPRLTTPSIDGGNGHLYGMSGGIQYDTSNTYDSDDGDAAGLKTSSEAVHAPKESTHWKFSKDSIVYDAVAVSADTFKSYGSYNTSAIDMSFPIAGDLDLSFIRSYSSFSGGQHKIGRGWNFLPASLVDNMPVAGGALRASCEGDLNTHRYKLAFQNQDTFETFTYTCDIDSGSYIPDEKNYHSIIVDTFPSSTETQYSVKLKNQTEYIFQEFFDDPFETTSYSMRLSKIKDKAGNEIDYTYESSMSAKLTRISDTNDHYIDLTYNDSDLISKITDWTAREVNYEYDDQGNLITVIDPNGEETHYSYNDNNKLDTIENREGDDILINTYLATSSAKLATQTDAGGLTTTYSYHETNRTIVATDSASPSRSHTTKYDSKARMLEDIDPYGNKYTYTYATESAPLTIRDKNNNLTTNTYDGNGNLTSVTFPDSKQTSYTYNDKNEVTKITDGRYGIAPKITQYTYDGDGNLTQASESGKITTYTYNGAGELLTLTNPLSKTTTWTRDTLGNPLTEIDPLSKSKTFEYDELGRLIKATDAENKFQTFTYDNNSNLLVSTDSAGITTKEYTKENLLKKFTLPDGTNTQFAYNDTGSLHSVNGALSSATTYDYDQYQNLTSSLNSLSKTTSYAYDKLNRKTSSTTPLGKATSLQYDANGNITKRTDANGKDTTYQYNNLNRLTQITHPDHSTIQYTYDDRGNMTSMTDPLGTTSYAYDIFNRLTQVTDPNSKVVSYAYSNNDNLAQITYPGSKMATYSYDDAGRLQTITDWNSQQTSYTYYGNGLIKTKTLPNGIVTTYSYDNANRLNSIQHKKSSTILAEFNYTRNAVGDITIATESGTLIGTTISSPSAITVNNLATFSSNSSNTLYTTSSISPTANKLLLLSVASRTGISTNPNQPTVSGNGLTWVAVDSRVYDDTSSSRRRITLFRAMGASPSSGALTISFGGQTQTTYTAIVDQASGIDTSGTNGSGAVVQSANNYDASASVSSLNVTLGSFGNTSNTTYGTFANANGTDSSTAGSGFTKYGDIADSSNDIRLMTEYKNSNDTGVDSSWGGNSELGGIGIELKASGITPPPSTITTTNKTSGSGTSASSINTSSITPGSNKLELLTVSSRTDISTNPNQPTVTGNGLTWVAINSIVYDTTSSSRRRVTMFRAMGASPSSGATTIDFGGQSQTDITWSNDELSGMDTSGTNGSGAIVQSTTNKDESGSATSLSLTLSSFANSANATYAGFGKDGNPSATAGTGFTTTADVASSTNVGTSTEWKNNNDTSVDISYSGAVLIGGIAVEVKAANTSSSNTSIFTYDSLRRLLSATLPSNTFSYTYDLVGNRLTQTADGVETSSTYNNDNKLTQNGSTNYTYDDNGNRITSGNKTLAYNFENKLATQSASGNPTIEFTYDGNGKRLGQKVNGSLTRRYINDVSSNLEKVLITQNLQNSTDNYYLYGNGLISEGGVSSGNRQYYLEDGIGNIRAITDSNGDSIDVIAYDPYGNQLSGSGSAEFKFKGEQLNSDTGYYYMRARYYDPTTGVFTSKDPFDGNLETPQSQNGYNFTNGNPVTYTDPSGKDYINVGLTGGIAPLGIGGGVLIGTNGSSGIYPYFAAGFSVPGGIGGSITKSASDPEPGKSTSIQGAIPIGIVPLAVGANISRDGTITYEGGIGTFGASAMYTTTLGNICK